MSFSSTCTPTTTHMHCPSFCESYQEVEEEGNHSPQEVGGKGVEGQVVWGEVADCQGGTFLLGGRGRRGLVTAMEIEGVKWRQSWRDEEKATFMCYTSIMKHVSIKLNVHVWCQPSTDIHVHV